MKKKEKQNYKTGAPARVTWISQIKYVKKKKFFPFAYYASVTTPKRPLFSGLKNTSVEKNTPEAN